MQHLKTVLTLARSAIIVAQNASTKFGGEALLLLNYFSILRARQVETLLVVHARTQAELKALFPASERANALCTRHLAAPAA
jgi:hypothetical protein